MTTTSLSVIIPTYNGAHKIIKILRALEKQTYSQFEVIVVIDGSTDETAAQIQNETFDLKLTVMERSNGGRSVSRNTGAHHAIGDLLLFFDDDIRPIPECVAIHVEHHLRKPKSILVGSPLEEIALSKTDLQKYKAYLSRKWMDLAGEFDKPLNHPFITAANFSIPKDLFFSIGSFDKNLNDAEDFDFAVRAFQLSIPIYVSKEAIGWHDDFITCRTYIKRQRQYQLAHGLLKQLKPELYTIFSQRQPKKLPIAKKIIYSIFSNRFWVKLIDHFNMLVIFPKRVRYLIYDFVITGLGTHFPNRKI